MTPNFIFTECTCAGKSNRWGEGSECKSHNGNYEDEDDWYNGVWCYANVESCLDAKAHPAYADHKVTGYGASKAACDISNYIYIS